MINAATLAMRPFERQENAVIIPLLLDQALAFTDLPDIFCPGFLFAQVQILSQNKDFLVGYPYISLNGPSTTLATL